MDPARPRARLHDADVIALIVGIVAGAGILRAPAIVAQQAGGAAEIYALWLAGGAITLAGALTYAELAAAFPHAGGEGHVLGRAFGRRVALAFGWARVTVIPSAAIAILALVYPPIDAALLVVAVTAANLGGLRIGRAIQAAATGVFVLALIALALSGVLLGGAAPARASTVSDGAPGYALIFVLLAYGGWSEVAYVSAEGRRGPRRVARAAVVAVAIVILLYLALQVAALRVLGLDGLRGAELAVVELARALGGGPAAAAMTALVGAGIVAALNATLLTGARSVYAVGRDVRALGALGAWDRASDAPLRAIGFVGALALAWIALASTARDGFAAVVTVTAPVFWGFSLLTGLALFRLRAAAPAAPRPFRVPLYPLTPLVFCAGAAWMLHASLGHLGVHL